MYSGEIKTVYYPRLLSTREGTIARPGLTCGHDRSVSEV